MRTDSLCHLQWVGALHKILFPNLRLVMLTGEVFPLELSHEGFQVHTHTHSEKNMAALLGSKFQGAPPRDLEDRAVT